MYTKPYILRLCHSQPGFAAAYAVTERRVAEPEKWVAKTIELGGFWDIPDDGEHGVFVPWHNVFRVEFEPADEK